jgi:flagellar assembly protein FliH
MGPSDRILRHRPVAPVVFASLREPSPQPEPEVADETAALELEAARAEAREAGYADGFDVGRQAGEYALRVQAERLRGLLDRSAHDVQGAVDQLEPLVVELALVVAGRIVEEELASCPGHVVGVLRAALAAAGTVRVVRVRVHPEDRPLIDAAWLDESPATVEVVADPGIQRGGCVVDTAAGFVDAQPHARLEELRRQIRASLGAGL